MNKKYLTLLLVALLGLGCASEEINKEVVPATDLENSENITNSTLISNPITADEAIKPETAAKIEFEEEVFDFGQIISGESIEHTFVFKNTGKNPLVINNCKGSCGCTIPEWPHSPIAPGGTGEIKVKFNSQGKHGEQDKTVTVTANTLPNNTTIRIVGGVSPNPEDKK